ncbi:MAG: hypothetical protein JWO96_834 [Candidatus Saccharibacteria bacterium]|nr:hypothetical protein [Candidatus Saccharibacteria bacterium]
MGTLLQANLSFGVALDAEQIESLPWDYEESGERSKSFEDWLKDLAGVVDPIPYEIGHGYELKALDDWVAKNTEAYEQYRAAEEKAEEECPIRIVPVYYEGEDGDSGCIIAVKSSVQAARWQSGSNPREANFAVSDEDVEAARSFCAAHNLPFDEPKWLISVYR